MSSGRTMAETIAKLLDLIATGDADDAAGRFDPFGFPWSSHKIGVPAEDGRLKRDAQGRQIFISRAEFLERYGNWTPEPIVPPAQPQRSQLALF